MPKIKTKSQTEKVVENYFPIEEDDLAHATEKKVKENFDRVTFVKRSIEVPVKTIQKEEILHGAIEKTFKKIDKAALEIVKPMPGKKFSKKTTKKASSKFSKTKKFSKFPGKKFIAPEITLKKNGYELVVTEKPQAALKIASALGKVAKRDYNKIPYYEVTRNGKKLIVANAVGHLFTLKQNSAGSSVPVFDISWVPNYLSKKADFTKKYYDTLVKLTKEAGSITIATDFDIEGEVIGLNVVRFIAGQQDASRMKFSTLTPKELNEAYENKSPTLSWGQAIAGETRHYLDWFYGINLSRALMNSIKAAGSFKIMSIGRVQGPALKLIVDKEKEIQAFKSEPYWQVFIKVTDNKNKLELKYIKDIFDKKELEKFKDLKGKKAQASTTKSEQNIPPQEPFNLTNLQTEAYKFHGINPSRTLAAAQALYLAGLISYPRTSSQKLPPSIGYKEILNKLAKEYKVESLIKREIPVEGKKTDPAHPSIYPTGNSQELSGDEEKVYNLIVRRFLSLFCEDAIIDNKTVKAIVNNENGSEFSQQKGRATSEIAKGKAGKKFSSENSGLVKTQNEELAFATRGMQVRKKAWLAIYPSKQKEVEIPDMYGTVNIIDSKIEEKETQPPKRYSPASIISQLEKHNLGTKATRSSILETLYDRGYVNGQSMEATPLGISLINTLDKYSPIIIDEKLTRHFEQKMESIIISKSGFKEKENKIIDEAKKTITDISKDFAKNQIKIGEALIEANLNLRAQEREANKVMPCPVCKKGSLAIRYSPKTKRNFIGCDAYPDCKTIYSLPPNGAIKKTDKVCEECNFPMLMRLSKGKKPWFFCFNKDCKTNKERIDEYRRKKEEEETSE